MKFGRMLKYDLRYGTVRRFGYYLLPLLLGVADAVRQVLNYYKVRNPGTLLDHWLIMTAGTQPYQPNTLHSYKFPTIWRNLALANFNKKNEEARAIEYMERAFRLDKTDARVLMELDQLYKRVRRSHAERLAFLQQYPELIAQRDDLVLEEITESDRRVRKSENIA